MEREKTEGDWSTQLGVGKCIQVLLVLSVLFFQHVPYGKYLNASEFLKSTVHFPFISSKTFYQKWILNNSLTCPPRMGQVCYGSATKSRGLSRTGKTLGMDSFKINVSFLSQLTM